MALIDFRMPHLDGTQVAAAVVRDELPTRVLLLSAHDESSVVYQALQAGAAGFLPKESTRAEIVSAVLDCAAGRDVLPPSIAAGLVGEVRRRSEPSGPTLSAREREVLGLIAQGASIPTIASQLFLCAFDRQNPRAAPLRETRSQRSRRRRRRRDAAGSVGVNGSHRSTYVTFMAG